MELSILSADPSIVFGLIAFFIIIGIIITAIITLMPQRTRILTRDKSNCKIRSSDFMSVIIVDVVGENAKKIVKDFKSNGTGNVSISYKLDSNGDIVTFYISRY